MSDALKKAAIEAITALINALPTSNTTPNLEKKEDPATPDGQAAIHHKALFDYLKTRGFKGPFLKTQSLEQLEALNTAERIKLEPPPVDAAKNKARADFLREELHFAGQKPDYLMACSLERLEEIFAKVNDEEAAKKAAPAPTKEKTPAELLEEARIAATAYAGKHGRAGLRELLDKHLPKKGGMLNEVPVTSLPALIAELKAV